MPLTRAYKEEINKEIANRVYAEGLKFKGKVDQLMVEISSLRLMISKLTDEKRGREKDKATKLLLHLDQKERVPKGWKAPSDWEKIVQRFAELHPRNKVAKLLAKEPDGDNQNFPDNHGKQWLEEEDIGLSEDLYSFIQFNARRLRRNPSSIAFRIVRQLKYIGIELF